MTENVTPFPVFPRAIHPLPDPLGLFLRVSRNDHKELLNLIASGDASFFGVVFDPTKMEHHGELREQVLKNRLDLILDPKTQQSSFPGGYNDKLGSLPWGVHRPHTTADFLETSGRRPIGAIGDFVLNHGFTQVLAPTHVLRKIDDPWFTVDIEAARILRNYLDKRGGADVPIIYSLAISYSAFRDREQRRALIEKLQTVQASSIWLKVDGFGSNSSATAVRNYIEAATEFHELGIPIIADHVGGLIGLSLLAFGAVSGMAHGITKGERFDSSHWRKPREGGGFALHSRVYFPIIDLMLDEAQARNLLDSSARARSAFGCRDTHRCPRGVLDMLENKGRHFLYQRIQQVLGISHIPYPLRPRQFLDRHLLPTTDKALAAANIKWQDESMAKKTQQHRKRLDFLRIALGRQLVNHPPQSFALLPKSRIAREARG